MTLVLWIISTESIFQSTYSKKNFLNISQNLHEKIRDSVLEILIKGLHKKISHFEHSQLASLESDPFLILIND